MALGPSASPADLSPSPLLSLKAETHILRGGQGKNGASRSGTAPPRPARCSRWHGARSPEDSGGIAALCAKSAQTAENGNTAWSHRHLRCRGLQTFGEPLQLCWGWESGDPQSTGLVGQQPSKAELIPPSVQSTCHFQTHRKATQSII